MRVEIWSDVVCPWCYVGKRRFESALARFDHRDEVEVVWRSFELDPSAPRAREGDYPSRLAGKYGVTVAQAHQLIDRITAAGAQDGLVLRFDRARPGNTFDAHRLLHLASDRGLQDQLKERLLAATFTEGRPIGDPETLAGIATEAGLDPGEARAVLAGDAYAAEVRADEGMAARLGIQAVPFFAVDRRYGVSGAQPPDVLLQLLERAWADAASPQRVPAPAGAACEGDECAL